MFDWFFKQSINFQLISNKLTLFINVKPMCKPKAIDVWTHQLYFGCGGFVCAQWVNCSSVLATPHIVGKGNPKVGLCPIAREAWQMVSTISRFGSICGLEGTYKFSHGPLLRALNGVNKGVEGVNTSIEWGQYRLLWFWLTTTNDGYNRADCLQL